MNSWGRVVGIGAVVALLAVGCSQRQESSSTETTTGSQRGTTTDTTAAPANGTTETPSWLSAIRGHEADLQSAIESGRLKEVHPHADALQATLKRAGQETTGLTAEQRSVFEQQLSDQAAIAEDMSAAGDSGDLANTKKEFARLRAYLRAIESQLGVAAQ